MDPHKGTAEWNVKTLETKKSFYKLPERGKKNKPYGKNQNQIALKFSTTMLETRTQYWFSFKTLSNKWFPINVHTAKLPVKYEDRITAFLDKSQKFYFPLQKATRGCGPSKWNEAMKEEGVRYRKQKIWHRWDVDEDSRRYRELKVKTV